MRKFFLAATLLLPSAANAYFYTGNDLVVVMREWEKANAGDTNLDVVKAGMYLGYILAANDTMEDQGYICSSARKVTLNQVAAVAAKYIDENPAEWDGPAYVLVLKGLAKAFPCPDPAPAN